MAIVMVQWLTIIPGARVEHEVINNQFTGAELVIYKVEYGDRGRIFCYILDKKYFDVAALDMASIFLIRQKLEIQ